MMRGCFLVYLMPSGCVEEDAGVTASWSALRVNSSAKLSWAHAFLLPIRRMSSAIAVYVRRCFICC